MLRFDFDLARDEVLGEALEVARDDFEADLRPVVLRLELREDVAPRELDFERRALEILLFARDGMNWSSLDICAERAEET